MLDSTEQKQIFAGSLVLILILSLISFWHRPDLSVPVAPVGSESTQEALNSKAYLDYLRAADINKPASDQLFQTILTKEDITQAVKDELQVSQTITSPVVDSSKIKISGDNSAATISNYLTQSVSQVYNFSTTTSELANSLYTADAAPPAQLKAKLQILLSQLYAEKVPKDALNMHEALIRMYLAYGDLLDNSQNFNAADYSQNDALWPQLYKNYIIANQSGQTYIAELNKLAAKNKISFIQVNYLAENSQSKNLGNLLVPQAQAFLGISDTSFTFTIGDIPSIIMDGAKEGLKSAFLQFMGAMLGKLITKIEQNYLVSNFLYYSDALVNGQYADDYLNKYVTDPLDKKIVKNLLPQFNCGKNANLKPVFQAQANQFLGFDPSSLSPSDPNFYTKMAKVGNFMSSSQGWELYYDGLAQSTETAAQKAVDLELTSSGLKTPRDIIQSNISASISNIISAERASFSALLQLGISNADSVISGVVGQLTQQLVNQFVFQGVTSTSGNIAVFKEQPTCVTAAIVNPVLPLPSTQYQASGPAPTQQAAMAQSCSGLSTLGTDCTTAIQNEIAICANTPASHTGYQSCQNVATSAYVKALLAQCGQQVRGTGDCTNLQNNISKIH